MKRKRDTFYLTVVVFVFLLGVILGWWFSDSSLRDSQIAFEKSELDLRSFTLRYENLDYFGSDLCLGNIIDEVGQEIYLSGVELDRLERDGLVNSKNYDFLKRKHNINQAFFYIYYQEYSKQCPNAKNMILFFFDSENKEISSAQGREIDSALIENEAFVLAMDFGYTDEIDFFYDSFGIETLPALVVNYNTTVNGFVKSDFISSLLE